MPHTLLDMLTYARPMGSPTERTFRDRYLRSLPGAITDAFGNVHVRIGTAPVLWSCHTDTVHHQEGRQTLHVDGTGLVHLSKRSQRLMSCLGADDTVGIWIMREMILRGVEGLYLFHYGEEKGGIGSRALAYDTPEVLAGLTCAIALDRKGTGDVITDQAGRCCSDVFAQSLADALNTSGLTYAPSDRGIYTDTAEYTDLIGECTNLSIGYERAHSARETCSLPFAAQLLEALCTLDIASLTIDRKPGDIDPLAWNWHAWQAPTMPALTMRDSVLAYDPDAVTACVYCGHDFEPDASTATDEPDLFCSFECETDSNALSARYERTFPSDRHEVYLDTNTADIQALLYKQTAKGYLK